MNELIGTEEVVLNDAAVTETITEATDALIVPAPFGTVDPEIYDGSAKRIQEQINLLILAREEAIKLESGLTTKAGLSKACKASRANLLTVRKALGGIALGIVEAKHSLLGTVGDVQKTAKKAKLKEKFDRITAELAAIEAAEASETPEV